MEKRQAGSGVPAPAIVLAVLDTKTPPLTSQLLLSTH